MVDTGAGGGLVAGRGLDTQLSGAKPEPFFPRRPRKLRRALLSPDSPRGPSRRSKVLQKAPCCQREAGDPVLSSPTTYGPVCPHRVVLPGWRRQLPPGRSQGVVADWLQENDLCPHPPTPLSRNCLHHIREYRAPERERIGEGVGKQVPARSVGAGGPSDSLIARARVPHPGLPGELPGTGCVSAQGPGPCCRWRALVRGGASAHGPRGGGSAVLPPSLGEDLLGREPQTQGCRARGLRLGSLQDRWDPGTPRGLLYVA